MGTKISNLVDEIKNQFQIYYSKFGDVNDRADFKFIMMLTDKFPNFEISNGFPEFLLNDVWEIIYDIFANYNIKLAIERKNEEFLKFVDFIEECANDKNFKHCVEMVFDGIYGVIGKSELYSIFKDKTVKIWEDYAKDWWDFNL